MAFSSFIHFRGLRFHVKRRPGPGEPLVFLHGMTDNAGAWDRVIAALGTYYDVTSYDLRAHGLSDAPDSGYEVADHAADLLALMESLDLQFVTIIGHSLGAEVAAHAAIRSPNGISRLVMIDPPWHQDWLGLPNQRRHLMARNWRRWLTSLQQMTLQEVVTIAETETPHWHPSDKLAWARAKHEARIESIESLLATRPGWQSVAAQLPCETLLVVGDTRLGAAVSLEQATEAVRLSSRIALAHIPGAGHGIHRAQVDAFRTALAEFLRRPALA